MLGKGWFPEQLGGLDRYFRDLFERLPEARALIVGPAPDSPERLIAASHHDAPLPQRLAALWRASAPAGRDADVIDAHFALYAIMPMLFGRIRSLPAVVHFQGPWADENVAAGDSSRTRRALRRYLERRVYRRASRVIVLTSAFRRVVVEEYRVSPWLVRVAPPGVDLVGFSPGDRRRARADLGFARHAFVALAVRRLVPRMGLDVLIDAWAHLDGELPGGSRLLIAGVGPQRAALEEQIARLGLGHSVELLGGVSDEGLVDVYRAADLGVVPTRSFEGFGLVVIEAAACGTPSIVTDVGGLPEAVYALDPTLIVPSGDVDALAQRIADAALRGALPSREATRSYAEGFSWTYAVERNRKVMREAIASPASGSRRIRVIYLDPGTERALEDLPIPRDDVETHVILAVDGPLADRLVQAGTSAEVLRLRTPAIGRSGSEHPLTQIARRLGIDAATLAHVVRLALRLRRLQPDVVHINSVQCRRYGSLAARLAGIPVAGHRRVRHGHRRTT